MDNLAYELDAALNRLERFARWSREKWDIDDIEGARGALEEVIAEAQHAEKLFSVTETLEQVALERGTESTPIK